MNFFLNLRDFVESQIQHCIRTFELENPTNEEPSLNIHDVALVLLFVYGPIKHL